MKRISVDLHGMTAVQARAVLLKTVKGCAADVDEIEVVHGFHGGQTLLQTVRGFSHPKVAGKILGLNNGMTILRMKK